MDRTATMPRLPVTRAYTAGVAVKPEAHGKPRWGLMGLALAVGFIPVVGPGIMHLVDRVKHGREAKDAKKELLNWYRREIAQQLGKRESDVSLSDLEKVKDNPTFRSLFERIEKERVAANRSSLVSATVATPLSMMPGVGVATKIATEMGVNIAANGAMSMLEKDRLLVDDVANHINSKRLKQGKINAQDALFMMLAHDKPMQDAIEKQHGKAFHKLPEAKQREVMASMNDNYLGYAELLTNQLNNGLITEQAFTVAAGRDEVRAYERSLAAGWAARVGGPRSLQRSGSYVDQVNVRRSAAALNTGGIV